MAEEEHRPDLGGGCSRRAWGVGLGGWRGVVFGWLGMPGFLGQVLSYLS